jgi:histidine triad (HIT) family protein
MTVFGKIINGELPCEKVYENEKVIAFKDIHPVAPVHILIVPKKAVKGLQDLQEDDLDVLKDVVKAAQEIADEQGILEGYRLITNNGPIAGQTVFHLHFHLIGGRHLGALG